jgi:hypothetical protein
MSDIPILGIAMVAQILAGMSKVEHFRSSNLRSVRIGVAGTHSTGKTTLLRRTARELQKRGYFVATVSDLASKAKDAGFPILREHTFESTLWIISRGIARELESELTAEVVLVDRPVPDALGYLLAALRFRNESLPPDQKRYLETLISLHSATYALLFKTEIDVTKGVSVEKVRDTDCQFRKLAANGIDRVFSALRIPVTPLPVDLDRAGELVLNSALSLLRKPT